MRFVFAGFMCIALCGIGLAQTTLPYTFTAGSPALASEVNANFQALVTAINKLEGHITAADIVGTYSVTGLQTGLHSQLLPNPSPPNPSPNAHAAGVEVDSYTGTFTFANDFACTFAPVENRHLLWWSASTFYPPYPQPSIAKLDSNITADNSTETLACTWSLTGGDVVVDFNPHGNPSQLAHFHAVSGGRLLVASSYNSTDDDPNDNGLLVSNAVYLLVRSN